MFSIRKKTVSIEIYNDVMRGREDASVLNQKLLVKSGKDDSAVVEAWRQVDNSRYEKREISKKLTIMTNVAKDRLDRIVELEKRLIKVDAENMKMREKMKAKNLHIKPWKDTLGRLRDPDTGFCMKTPDPILVEMGLV